MSGDNNSRMKLLERFYSQWDNWLKECSAKVKAPYYSINLVSACL
jgi:hypothetical protein